MGISFLNLWSFFLGRRAALVLGTLLVTMLGGRPCDAQCSDWLADPVMRLKGVVNASALWDPDGGGPLPAVLVVGGEFDRAGGPSGVVAGSVATWNGSAWQALGAPFTDGASQGTVRALAVWNGQLIAGGEFTANGGLPVNYIARWNGSSWQAMGSGIALGKVVRTHVSALATYNGELIAGGDFTVAGGVSAKGVARWNGSVWSSLGTGMEDEFFGDAAVYALTVYHSELIAGGVFTTAGGVPARHVARWNGSVWSPLGQGIDLVGGIFSYVLAFTTFNGDLIAGGFFDSAGGAPASQVARWNGTSWSAMGEGISVFNNRYSYKPYSYVYALGVQNNQLYAAGWFSNSGSVTLNNIGRWSGSAWQALGDGSGIDGSVDTLAVYNNELLVGGYFEKAGALNVDAIARWNGSSWLDMEGVGTNAFGTVYAITPWSGGMVVAGNFNVNDRSWGWARDLAFFDGQAFKSMGEQPDNTISNASVLSVATGPGAFPDSTNLYVGGDFTTIDTIPANRIAKRNDTGIVGWSAMGAGFADGTVYAITVHNGSVYAGGSFIKSGTKTVNHIARWDGSNWQPVGAGTNGPVFALASYNGALYAGGQFTTAGSFTTGGFARWYNNSIWQPVDTTIYNGTVYAITPYQGGLAVGGLFPGYNGSPNINIYSDAFILNLNTGGTNGFVSSITVSNDTLVIGGGFTSAGGLFTNNLARYSGPAFPPNLGTWTNYGGATDGPVYALAAAHGELYLGGGFQNIRSNTVNSPYFARYAETGVPWFSGIMFDQFVCNHKTATFVAEVAAGYKGLTFTWRKDGLVIGSGATGTGSTRVIDGPRLQILLAGEGDEGTYDCRVSNACGSTDLSVAHLFACSADMNCDGFLTADDYDAFVLEFEAGNLAADFVPDGFVTGDDFDAYVDAFIAGC